MKKYLVGFLCGLLLCGGAFAAYADQPIAIIVNGQTIQSEVDPIAVDGRVLVPTRVIAEALGADVQWDPVNNAVVITTNQAPPSNYTPSTPLSTDTVGSSWDNPIPAGQQFLCPNGVKVKVAGITKGSKAWSILKEADANNEPPESGMQYVLVQLEFENESYKSIDGAEDYTASGFDIAIMGSDKTEYDTTERYVVQPTEGPYARLLATIKHSEKASGCLSFYIPVSATELAVEYDMFGAPVFFDAE